MAKKQISAIVVSCVASMVDALSHASSIAAIVTAEKESTASMLRDALFSMRDAAADTGDYLTACEEVYGNGLRHTAKDYRGGLLRERLTDAKVDLATIKVYMAMVRATALWLADPTNNAARVLPSGAPLSLGAMYKLAKLAKNPAAPANTSGQVAPANTSGQVAPESIGQMIAKFGLVAVLRECAATLATHKETKTDSIAIAAIGAKLVAQKLAA